MSRFQPGDRVVVNGNQVAEIHTWDEGNNRLVFVTQVGGGTDTTYGHISQYRVERLVSEAVVEPPLPFVAEDESDEDDE